jgi:WD40 repeat protein
VVATGIGGLILAVAILAVSTLLLFSAYQTEAEQRARADTHLYNSFIGQAKAMRQARGTGYRDLAWGLLQQALQLRTPEKDVWKLRQEAVACMGDFVGLEPTTWKEFEARIQAIALQPHGKQLAVGLQNGTLLVQRIDNGAVVARLSGPKSPLVNLSFAADGQPLASAYLDGTIQVWQANARDTWNLLRLEKLDPPTRGGAFLGPAIAVGLAPDGQSLAVCTSDQAIVRLWSMTGEARVAEFRAPGRETLCRLAFSPQGNLLAAGYYGPEANGFLVWNVATRKLIPTALPASYLGPVTTVAFSPDGRYLAVACVSSGITLYETADLQRPQLVAPGSTWGVAFGPDSQLIAIPFYKTGSLRLWNSASNLEVGTLSHPSELHAVAFSQDGKQLVAATHESIHVWNLAGAGDKLLTSGHARGICTVAFHPDGGQLASAGSDGKVKIWDPITGKLIKELGCEGGHCEMVAFSHDGKLLAAGGASGTIQFWATGSWQELKACQQDLGHYVWRVAFSPDGHYFAACSGPLAGGAGSVELWCVELRAGDTGSTPRLVLERRARLADQSAVHLCFSLEPRETKFLVWVERPSGAIHVWDLANSRIHHPLFPAKLPWGIRALAFLPADQQLTFIGSTGIPEVWNLATGERIFSCARARYEERGEFGDTIAVSADGVWLAQRGLVNRVWDLQSGELLLVLPEEHCIPWCLAWSPDRRLLAVGSEDGSLVIWNLPTMRRQLATIGLDW